LRAGIPVENEHDRIRNCFSGFATPHTAEITGSR
jgi:hypothetical protein